MASVVLEASNHVSSTSFIWSRWASAPFDLLLVAEVDLKDVQKIYILYIVHLPRMEWLKPIVACSSHFLTISQLLLKLCPTLVSPRYPYKTSEEVRDDRRPKNGCFFLKTFKRP